MGSVRSQANVTVHFVKNTNVELAELGSRCDGGKERSSGITGSNVVRGETSLIPRDVVGEVPSHEGTGSNTDASGGGELGHVEHIKRSGGDDAAGGVFDSKVGSLVGLEGHFAPLAWHEGSFENGGSISLVLDFVEVETGVGEFSPHFGGEGAGGGAVCFHCDCYWASLALAF